MLVGSFPDLREALIQTNYPLEFILKRDSQTEPVGQAVTQADAGEV